MIEPPEIDRGRVAFRRSFLIAFAMAVLVLAARSRAAEIQVPGDNGAPWTMRIAPETAYAAGPNFGSDISLLPPPPPAPADDESPAIAQPAQKVGRKPRTAPSQDVPEAALPPAPPWSSSEIVVAPGAPRDAAVNGRSYQAVYNSIPFSRTEYLANPSYRHEATMEILFGQLRPTTINRHDTPVRDMTVPYTPYRPYLFSTQELWRLNRPWSRFMYPYPVSVY